MNYLLAVGHARYTKMLSHLISSTGEAFFLVDSPKALTPQFLAALQPRYVFFPHWSWIIPESIWSNYECIMFHMTDLPFGRGGSPLQNLIARGIYETHISAFRCIRELDAGPIYLKKPLSLYGSAEEIYLRSATIIEQMIVEIIQKHCIPIPQQGKTTLFPRRTPEQGNIDFLQNLEKIYDYIRMLDADGYPPAFLESENLRLEFRRAHFNGANIRADVTITLKGQL